MNSLTLRDVWGTSCEPTFHEIIQQRITTKNHEIYELSSHVFAFGWLSGQAMQYTKRAVSKTLANACVFQRFVFFLGGFPVVSWCLCRAVLLVYPPRPGLQKKGNQAKQRQGALKSKTRTPNHSWLKPGGSMKSSPALFFCAALRVVFVLFLFFLFCFLCLCLSLQHKQEKE